MHLLPHMGVKPGRPYTSGAMREDIGTDKLLGGNPPNWHLMLGPESVHSMAFS